MDTKNKDALLEEFERDLTDAEMDKLLADRHDEIEALLEEARRDKAADRGTPMEPIEEFLRKALARRDARKSKSK